MSRSSLMFIGTYTRREPHVAGKAEGIYTYAVDGDSGTLTHLAVASGLDNPSYLAISPSGRFLYSVGEVGDFDGEPGGGVAAYAIDEEGTLTLLNSQPSHGVAPCYLSVDATGPVSC